MGREPTPIKSVSVITTGTAEAHIEHVRGSRMPPYWWIFMSRRWVSLPINVYVLEHQDGLVLFDAGQDKRVLTDPNFWPDRVTRFFMRHLFRFHIGPQDTLSKQLELAGFRTADVKKVVVSHLHVDHVGCIGEVPQADLYIDQKAWEHMMGPHPEREAVLRRDIDIPEAKWHRIIFSEVQDATLSPFDQAYDLMGDGSLMVIPTPGHLPGSVSMLVRCEGAAPLLLVGDLCYSTEMLMRDKCPGTGDKKQLRETYAKVRALKERMPELVILSSHDPDAAGALAQVW